MHRPRRAGARLSDDGSDTLRLVRDRATVLSYLQLGCWGYFLYGFGPTQPLLREEQGVSLTVSGLHGTALAAGGLVAGFVTPAIVRRVGRGALIWAGVAIVAVAAIVYTSSPAIGVTLTGAVLASFGGSMVVNGVPAVLAERHGASGAAAVTEANALAAGLGIVAPLVIGTSVALGLGWRAGILVVVPFSVVLWLSMRSVRLPAPAELPPTSAGPDRLPGRYWLAWGLVSCCVSVEFCMNLWAGDVLRERAGMTSAASSAALAAVVGGMTVGRVFGTRLALRIASEQLMLGALAVAAAGFALFWFASAPVTAVAGLGLTGLGLALHYPIGVVIAVRESLGRPDRATARVGIGIALAVGIGPFGLGAIADRTSTHTAFLLVPGLLAIATVLVLAVRRATPDLTAA
jgi:predicted MFS family arabinose efflux permease